MFTDYYVRGVIQNYVDFCCNFFKQQPIHMIGNFHRMNFYLNKFLEQIHKKYIQFQKLHVAVVTYKRNRGAA